jgi:osmoprotectant transport system permease protein
MVARGNAARPECRNKVLLTLCFFGAAFVGATGFIVQSPNRLVSGRPIALWVAVETWLLLAIIVATVVLFLAAFLPPSKKLHRLVILASAALFVLTLYGAGLAADILRQTASPAARTGLGPAFWGLGLCAILAIVDGLQRLKASLSSRLLTLIAILGAVTAMTVSGTFDDLSVMREYAVRRSAFAAELGRHCVIVTAALIPAVLIGAPLGLLAARQSRTAGPIFVTLNILQTIPSVALFGLLIAPLSALAKAAPALAAFGVGGIGIAPALIALVLYALLPIVRNTHAGVTGVDAALLEAARGMGMTSAQIFWQVERPLAAPVFLAGVRIVMVQTIGLAVVAALIGAGGLGTFVFQGLGQYAIDLILLGAVPAILLALAADFTLKIFIELTAQRSAP